jgi:hypothetical protein
LCEERRVSEDSENASAGRVDQFSHVHDAGDSIEKRDPETVKSDHFNGLYICGLVASALIGSNFPAALRGVMPAFTEADASASKAF